MIRADTMESYLSRSGLSKSSQLESKGAIYDLGHSARKARNFNLVFDSSKDQCNAPTSPIYIAKTSTCNGSRGRENFHVEWKPKYIYGGRCKIALDYALIK